MYIRNIRYPQHRQPHFKDTLEGAPLVARIVAYYRHRLLRTPQVQAVLSDWGLGSEELWQAFHVGHSDGTLPQRLPSAGPWRQHLVEIGLLTPDGEESLAGCVVIPKMHPQGYTALHGLPIQGGPERHVVFEPGGFVGGNVLTKAETLHVFPTAQEALCAWHTAPRTTTCLQTLPQTADDLVPLRRLFSGSELCFHGFPPPADTDVWQHLKDELRVGGLHLYRAEEPLTEPVTTSVDLRAWQARFSTYLTGLQLADHTVSTITNQLKPFFGYLHGVGIREITELSPVHVEGYRTHLFSAWPGRPCVCLATKAQVLSSARRFTRFLYKARYLPTDPGAQVEAIRTHPRPPAIPLTEAQTLAVITRTSTDTVLELRNRAILELFYSSAVRNSELCRLTLDDVDFSHQDVRIRYGKGRKHRVVPLGQEASDSLQAYLRDSRPHLVRDPRNNTLFLSYRGKRFLQQTLGPIIQTISEAAGARVLPHQLRRACVTHMARRGAGLRHLQDLLGHESLATTQIYVGIEISDLKAMHARFHPREQRP